jgi:hypothetical protein
MRVPSMDEIWEVSEARGANSEAPHLWEGLVCAWPMLGKGDTTIWDVSGYRHHAKTFNMNLSQSWTLRPDGPGLWADGINDYVQAISDYPLLRFSKAHTLLWYGDLDTTGGVYPSMLLGKMTWGAERSGGLHYRPTQIIEASYAWSGSDFNFVGASITPSTPRADHIVATYEPSTAVRLYFNGRAVVDYTTSIPSTFYNNCGYPHTLFVRSNVDGNFTRCTCLQAAMWSRALSPSEVWELASNPWAMYRVRPRVLVRGVTLKKTPIHHLTAGCT